jgi:hypothetical protein
VLVAIIVVAAVVALIIVRDRRQKDTAVAKWGQTGGEMVVNAAATIRPLYSTPNVPAKRSHKRDAPTGVSPAPMYATVDDFDEMYTEVDVELSSGNVAKSGVGSTSVSTSTRRPASEEFAGFGASASGFGASASGFGASASGFYGGLGGDVSYDHIRNDAAASPPEYDSPGIGHSNPPVSPVYSFGGVGDGVGDGVGNTLDALQLGPSDSVYATQLSSNDEYGWFSNPEDV